MLTRYSATQSAVTPRRAHITSDILSGKPEAFVQLLALIAAEAWTSNVPFYPFFYSFKLPLWINIPVSFRTRHISWTKSLIQVDGWFPGRSFDVNMCLLVPSLHNWSPLGSVQGRGKTVGWGLPEF